MRKVGTLLGLFLAATFFAYGSMGDKELPDDQPVKFEQGEEFMVACKKAGLVNDLSGAELDVYVKNCMDNPDSEYVPLSGEDRE